MMEFNNKKPDKVEIVVFIFLLMLCIGLIVVAWTDPAIPGAMALFAFGIFAAAVVIVYIAWGILG